jgi:hypothetical protein
VQHHAGADRLVGRLVDHDEGAGRAVARVGVDGERLGQPEADPADVVQLEPFWPLDLSQRAYHDEPD